MNAVLMTEKEINNVVTEIFNERKRYFKDSILLDSITELDGDNETNLVNFMRMMEEFCERFDINSCFNIRNIYFDMGAGMKWTQIIAHTNPSDDGYQLLNPRDHRIVVSGRDLEEIKNILVSEIKTHLKFVINDYQITLNNLRRIQESI